jgi:phage minor structural protein
MIKIFGITDKSYTTNGDIVLQASKVKIHKQDNGDFYINVEAPLSYIDYLVPNNIIVANTPQGDQAFRITNVENTRSKIKVKAYHVFYDSKNYLIQDSYVVEKNCNDALDHLNNSTDTTSPFTTISDITSTASYRCVRKSLYGAIQVLLERYGGHLVRDNWTIGIRNSIGQDNGVTIRYGKNLKDIKAVYNWDNVVTKLLPVGKDGLLLNAIDSTQPVYVESDIQYDIPYTKTINFDQSNVLEENYQDEEGNTDEEAYTQALVDDLMEQAQTYVDTNSVPVVNYTLSANVEKVSDIGDTVEVIDEKLGINLLTNIISYEYDCILEKYTQIEFGNFVPTLSGLVNTITSQTQELIEENTQTLQVTLGQELQQAQDKIWNALGSSYVIYEGDKILVVDSLPKETATNVIMINNGGIAFGHNGINGAFSSAWTIDNVLNMEQINVINLTADLIKGGTLKLGSNLNQNGQLEVYDEANNLIAELNKNGLKMYGVDGSYILMNNEVGFSGYDRLGNQIYWVSKDEFHMKKSVVEEEITLCNKMRFIPIEIYDTNNNLINDGIGLVSVAGGGS